MKSLPKDLEEVDPVWLHLSWFDAEFFVLDQAASYLSVEPSCLKDAIRRGYIKYYQDRLRHGVVFKKSDLDEYALKLKDIKYFIDTDPDWYPFRSNNGDLPACLESESLYRMPTPKRISGVYFLCKDRCVVYVGQSVDVFTRISTHASNGMLFDAAFYKPVHEMGLLEEELLCIKKYRPKYNKKGNRD